MGFVMQIFNGRSSINLPFIIAFIVIIVPQIILKPFGGDLSIVDIGAPLVIFFCAIRKRLNFPPSQLLLLLFIFYVFSSYFIMMLFYEGEYISSSPYLIRMISMYAPVFLVPYMKREPEEFYHFGRVFVVVSLVVTTVIVVLYAIGWGNFNAHQTTENTDGITVNRLGGLAGESGAFAYNVLFIFYMVVIVYFAAEKKRYKQIISFITVMFVLFISFKYSLARVILICAGAVMFFGYLFSPVSLVKKYFVLFFAFLLCVIVSFYLTSSSLDLSTYRLSNLSNTDLNSVSSGRVSHWMDAVALYTESPLNVIFGVGHRMSVRFLGHAVENFFIQNLLDYGVIGTTIFVIFIWSLLKPIIKDARTKNGVSIAVLIVFTGIFLQWQFNDINTYYQTYPATLFFLSWWSLVCREKIKTNRDSLLSE